VAALAWPTIFLAPAGSIGGIDFGAAAPGVSDADIRAKMAAVCKGMAMGITELGGHDGAQTKLLFGDKAMDAPAARTAKLSAGECSDVAGMVKSLGYADSSAVGNGTTIVAKASAGLRFELAASEIMLSKFKEPLDGPADIAGRIELMKKVKAQMESSPRLARVLEWSVGLNVERAAELIAALEKQSAAIARPRMEKIGSHRVVLVDLSGGLGETAFASAVTEAGQMADAGGPGQIIVLEIDSFGGLVTELYKFVDAIRAVRERHRVVAWVRQAISGAAVTSMQCNEIYFRSMGALGAATMIHGPVSADSEIDKFLTDMGDIIEKNGRPRSVFEAMVKAKAVLTYTKDPATGKSTFHDKITGLPGEVVLSDEKEKLTFNASNALDCGFSKGTADSLEQLAPLLGLR